MDLISDSTSHGHHGEQGSGYNYKIRLDVLQGEILYEQNRLDKVRIQHISQSWTIQKMVPLKIK